MDYPWIIHRLSIDFHDMSMMFLLDFYGVSMGFFGISMGLLWHPSGMSMMFFSDISLGFFWDFHGIIQGFLEEF